MNIQRKIMVFGALLVFLSTSALSSAAATKGWDDCQRGKSCTKPQCRQWVDSNKNKICDHGEKNPTTTISALNLNTQTTAACHSCTGCGLCSNV